MNKKQFKLRSIFLMILCIFGVIFAVEFRCLANEYSELLEKEPIDVVITYVDLTDPKLQMSRNLRLKKEEDNNELRYAVRSVLKNIPWIRKIFIVMPNEKVRYFKNSDDIKEKIVYINDRDVLGFDSRSSITFEFNFWRLKKFGVSNNFIYMNDDFFIGKPLKKSDFFYVDKGKVVPYVLFDSAVGRNEYKQIKSFYKDTKKYIKMKNSHTGAGFKYQRMSSFMFLYTLFGQNAIAQRGNLMYFPHNALGENQDELKEIYDVVKNKYKYPDACLNAVSRSNNALQHQTFYNFYIINKYGRKIKRLTGKYIDLAGAPYEKYDSPLFCINTGGDTLYTDENYAAAKIIMNKLFPVPTKYELPALENGTYTIESALRHGKVWDIESASAENAANLRLWNKNNTNAQKFNVRMQKDGTYIIEPLCSYKRIDVYGANKEPGANICQYDNNGTQAQRWYLISAGKGYFYIVSACNNLCADVEEANICQGTNIRCWTPNGTRAQKFRFIKK